MTVKRVVRKSTSRSLDDLLTNRVTNPALGPDPARADLLQDDEGMGATLGDLYAGLAMVALMTGPHAGDIDDDRDMADRAWNMAESMLRERMERVA